VEILHEIWQQKVSGIIGHDPHKIRAHGFENKHRIIYRAGAAGENSISCERPSSLLIRNFPDEFPCSLFRRAGGHSAF
jgi:hypothetical protein